MPAPAFLFALAAFLAFLGYYGLEKRTILRRRKAVPLRIGVTGARGKSSVTRLVAAALRAGGRRVVAKTTGSRPVLIHVDGSEERVDRRGPASILEQRRLLALAEAEGAEVLVAEIMSIEPECQAVESEGILGIGVCAVTNVRIDHAEEQGRSRREVARALARSVPRSGLVVCLEGEDPGPLGAEAARKGARLVLAPRRFPEALRMAAPALRYAEFEENLCLALAVCREAGLDEAAALASMRGAVPDFGALRLWRWRGSRSGAPVLFANAFAANDPESTRATLSLLAPRLSEADAAVGILNLREDRPERTRQWIEALASGAFRALGEVYIVGPQASLARRRVEALRRRAARRPAGEAPIQADPPRPRCLAARERGTALLGRIEAEHPGSLALVGLGNIAGPGGEIARLCEALGEPYEL